MPGPVAGIGSGGCPPERAYLHGVTAPPDRCRSCEYSRVTGEGARLTTSHLVWDIVNCAQQSVVNKISYQGVYEKMWHLNCSAVLMWFTTKHCIKCVCVGGGEWQYINTQITQCWVRIGKMVIQLCILKYEHIVKKQEPELPVLKV